MSTKNRASKGSIIKKAFYTIVKANRLIMDLSRFDAASLIAFTAAKEIDYGTATDGRILPRCGADRTEQWAYA